MPWIGGEYRPRTGSEWLTFLRDRYVAWTTTYGLSAPRWMPHSFTNLFMNAVSYAFGDLDEALAAVPDVRSPRNATGAALREIAELANVVISEGTASTATLTITAWANGPVVISPSDLFRGGGTDGLAEWSPNETVTVAAGDSDDVNIVCTSVGAVLAGPNTITTRVRVPAGVVSATNAAAASPGTEADDDDAIRLKILNGSSIAGSRSAAALRDRVLAVPGVQYCRVVPNDTLAAVTVSGRSVPANGYAVWVHPDTLSDESATTICDIIYATKDASAAISYPSTTGSTGVKASYVDGDNITRALGFWWVREHAVPVRVTVTRYETGYTLPAQVATDVRGQITAFFATLAPGDILAQQSLTGDVTDAPGVGRATVEYRDQDNPGTDPATDTWGSWVSTDTTPDAGDVFVLYGTPTVS